MSLEISDEIIRAIGMSEQELALALATTLFEKERLTLGQAAKLAGMGQWEFRRQLAALGIPLHYDVAELEHDLATIRELRGS
jgi:predicted HTH domain antitoxin